MINVIKLEVGQLKSNCYLVYDSETKETLIIDPGDDADYITGIILQNELKPVQIVATHGHFDHILAATELILAFGVRFLMHKKDAFLLDRMESSATYYTKVRTTPSPVVDMYLSGSELIKLGDTTFMVIETPGHTPGSVCLYNKQEKILFCGDLIFEGNAVGRTDFKYSNRSKLVNSIEQIKKLPEDTKVYSGHGNSLFLSEFNTGV